jgi:hypothetical protein
VSKRVNVKQLNERVDYYCTVCDEVMSLYVTKKNEHKMRKSFFCMLCGENTDIVKHSFYKHGGITGRTPWTAFEIKRLKGLLNEKLSWEQIHVEMGGKRSSRSLKQYAYNRGYVKRYKLTTNQFGIESWREDPAWKEADREASLGRTRN